MGEGGRPRQPLTVTADEREVLVRWSRRPKAPHSIAQRARIVLLAADGMTNVAVADKVGINTSAVRNPELITAMSKECGAQAVVLAIDGRRRPGGGWTVYTQGGRVGEGIDRGRGAARGGERGGVGVARGQCRR